jgi:hypothetical protein
MIKTRTQYRADGSCEIIRILDQQVLGRWSPGKPLAFEKSVVWLKPLEGLDFVRVALIANARSRRGPLLCGGGQIALGYSKLTVDAPRHPDTGGYVRRIFYLKEKDSQLNMNQFPPDAIDPRTVLPGFAGDPPRVEEWERGYPHYMRRAVLGLPIPSALPPTPVTS